jgi:adenine-specific DNA-methyltransferase
LGSRGKGREKLLQELIDRMNTLPGKDGWLTKNYCTGTIKVWQKANCQKADAIRDFIEEAKDVTTAEERDLLVACLILALDKVDNTVGVQQAYLKQWCQRSYKELNLILPPAASQPNHYHHHHMVGNCLLLDYPQADIAYVDPPYSHHCYATYYHLWDSIVLNDKPEVGLTTNRRIDRVRDTFDETMKSPWNSRKSAAEAFHKLFQRLPVRYILVSYSGDALLPTEELLAICEKHGKLQTVKRIGYGKHIMCKIGNAAAKQTKDRTEEYLILIDKSVS